MNTKLRLLMAMSLVALASACGKNDDKEESAPAGLSYEAALLSQLPSEPEFDTRTVPVIDAFDIDNIPVSSANIGEFPFFTPPSGYKYVTPTQNVLNEEASLRESDRVIYPIGSDRIRMVEGKTLKAALYNEKQKEMADRDFLLVHRHYEDAITAAGGVRVYGQQVKIGAAGAVRGTMAPDEYQTKPDAVRIPRRVYVIHRQDAELWFEIDCGTSAGCLFNVTQKSKM